MFRGLLVAALIAASALSAEAAKRIDAVRVDDAPRLDGKLDDAAWQKGVFVDDFLQKQPVENGEPSRRTEVAFVYTGEALYVGARMYAPGRDAIQAVMTRRDETGSAERIIVSFDTFMDGRTAYSFAVTAAGVRADWFHPDDSEFSRDHSFDPVWDAEARFTADGWVAEMRIPFSQLRFPGGDDAGDDLVWGVNINRYVPQLNEDIFWIPVPKDVTAWSSYFGELHGIHDVSPKVRLELLPYAAGDTTITSPSLVSDDDPFAERADIGARAGLDLKMGLGPSLTLDMTVNPDFGQVEADPAVVNLTAFETSFAERRPFFVEGAQLLRGTGPQYFYSRRIGAPPGGSADGDYVAVPQSTRIIGAAKLTGRTPAGTSVGALTALTQRARARVYDLASDTKDELVVEPLTTYNVARVQQELLDNGSIVGATATAVYRDLGPRLGAELAEQAYTGGADWRLRLGGGAYELSGNAGFTTVRGSAGAIALLQQTSTHYYQRPDQDHVELDPTRGHMNGWTASLATAKRNGRVRFDAGATAESPGFEPNDVGLLFSADDIYATAAVSYVDNVPAGSVHSWGTGLRLEEEWNFGGHRKPGLLRWDGNLQFANFWRLSGQAYMLYPGLDDDLTRGGPLAGRGWGYGGGVALSSSHSARTEWTVGALADAWETGYTGGSVNLDVAFYPIDRLQLSFGPRYRQGSDNRQYVDTIARGNGARYLFGTVDRREFALRTRVQVAFTPTLFLDLYAEPFASSGRYRRFGELAAARGRDLRTYGEAPMTSIEPSGDEYMVTADGETFTFDDPDFSVLSLRSTAVLRWEFRPGSTLFVVWQQNRAGDDDGAATPLSLGEAFASPGSHTLAVKLTWWFAVD